MEGLAGAWDASLLTLAAAGARREHFEYWLGDLLAEDPQVRVPDTGLQQGLDRDADAFWRNLSWHGSLLATIAGPGAGPRRLVPLTATVSDADPALLVGDPADGTQQYLDPASLPAWASRHQARVPAAAV